MIAMYVYKATIVLVISHISLAFETQKEKIKSLAEAIRASRTDNTAHKQKPFQPPTVNEKHKKKEAEFVSVRFQWMHFNDSKFASKRGYKQVLASDGGGTREFQMNKNVKYKEILQKATDIYFQGGISSKGTIQEMTIDIADFTMKPIKYFTDLNQVECSYKTHLSCRGLFPSRSAVILMTKRKDAALQGENTATEEKKMCHEKEPKNVKSKKKAKIMKMDTTNSKTINIDDKSRPSDPSTYESMSTINIKYTKVKQSLYCKDPVSISVSGRNQAKEILKQENGEPISDPLDEFEVRFIGKDGKVYLDTEISKDMLKETVPGLQVGDSMYEQTKLKYVFSNDSSDPCSIIIHGPDEIFGMDGDEFVIGVICRKHGNESDSLSYKWFKDDKLFKSGTNQNIIAIDLESPGTYFCEVVDGKRKQISTALTFDISDLQQEEIKSSTNDSMPLKEDNEDKPLIPIVAVEDIQFSKADEIGKGAFARVYKGNWIGCPVAIKVVELKKRAHNKIKAMVEGEIMIHSKIRHPNIVQLMSVAYDLQNVYLVSEFINGYNMEDVLFDESVKSKFTLTLSNKLYISLQCLQAISYLHGMEPPIIHRDIKPANILIDCKSYVTKLCDLGVSRVKSYTKYSMTNLGGQPGTPAYMAPEVIQYGKSATMKSDVWSIGVSLVELFAGEETWGDLDTPEDVKEVLEKKEAPVSLKKVDEPMKSILENCLNYKPEDRPNALQVLSSIKKHVHV